MRSFIFIIICSIFLGSAAYLGNMYIFQNPETPTRSKTEKVEYINVLTVNRTVDAGEILDKGSLSWSRIEASVVSPQFLAETNTAIGDLDKIIVTQPLAAGTILENQHLLHPGESGYLAALIGMDLRAKIIDVSNLADYANLLFPGDHVDLILTYVAGRRSGGGVEVVVKTLLSNVKVVAVTTRGKNQPKAATAPSLTLALSPKEVEIASLAEKVGSLAIVLRGVNGKSGDVTRTSGDILVRESDLFPAASQRSHPVSASAPRDVRMMRGGDLTVLTLPGRRKPPASLSPK